MWVTDDGSFDSIAINVSVHYPEESNISINCMAIMAKMSLSLSLSGNGMLSHPRG